MSFVCEYCKRIFTQNRNLKQHDERCKEKPIFILTQKHKEEIQQLKDQYENQIQVIQAQLHKQQQQIEEQLHKQQQQIENQIVQYEKKIEEQKIQYEKQIEKLEIQNLEYHNQIFEIAKQPSQVTNHNNSQTTNNRILNITNHLIPIETDEEIRKMIDNQYTRDIFLGGSESLKDMTVSILKDQETGKYRTVCSDASRSVFYYLDNENKLVKDIGMKNIHKKIQKPLFAVTSLHYKEIDQEGSIDDDKLCEILSDNINFIDHELPNQLKPELQLPINLQE